MARFYVAKKSLIGATPTPIQGKKEFEGKCLKRVHHLLTQGVDWADFPNRTSAMEWVNDNQIPVDERVVRPSTTSFLPKPVGLQMLVGFLVIVAFVAGFTVVQHWYVQQCMAITPWKLWETAYNLSLSPTCRFYQNLLVEGNTYFIQILTAFLGSFAIFLYPLFMSAWRTWTPFDEALLSGRFAE